jgi:prephenate dehydrogenase
VNKEKPRVTIVGLGLIGSSMGLALRQARLTSAVVGHDIDRGVAGQAKKSGAVDRTVWNLLSACEDSDLILLAAPLDAIKPTLEAIGPELRPGCVVIDTATVKEPVLAWAASTLPDGVHFVGGDPLPGPIAAGLSGVEAARADLFQNGLFCVVPSPSANEDAVKLAIDLVQILGAKPLFLDAVEHDGLMAAVEHLPAILALALMEAVVEQPAWRELRKVAGASLETGTKLAAIDPIALGEASAANRVNLMRWIDTYIDSLSSIRTALETGEPEDMVERFQTAFKERAKWLHDWTGGDWFEGPRTEMPSRSSLLDSLVGTFWRRQPRKEDQSGE